MEEHGPHACQEVTLEFSETGGLGAVPGVAEQSVLLGIVMARHRERFGALKMFDVEADNISQQSGILADAITREGQSNLDQIQNQAQANLTRTGGAASARANEALNVANVEANRRAELAQAQTGFLNTIGSLGAGLFNAGITGAGQAAGFGGSAGAANVTPTAPVGGFGQPSQLSSAIAGGFRQRPVAANNFVFG